jgi:aminoglycoside 3-N-acetyltransferase
MLRHHALDGTPIGEQSPYRALRDRRGQILMLGCGLKPNTSMHGVEELVEPPYLLTPDVIPYEVVLADASRVRMACRGHNFDGWAQRYDRLGPLLEGDELQKGRVLDAKSHLIEAEAMWRKAEKALRKDPFYFVEQVKSDA